MALPKINEVPTYTATIPSTGKKITYRPFLVKEQKILMIALESGDEEQVVQSIINTLKACIVDNVNVDKLATFDIEYLFTQVRAKSVGETSTIGLKCVECGEVTDVTVDISSIEMKVNTSATVIKLNDQYSLKMRYPNYKSMSEVSKIATEEKASITNTLYSIAVSCLDELMTEEDRIKFEDESHDDIEDFMGNLDPAQFDKVMEFVMNIPRLQKDVEYECSSCSHHNTYTLQGLGDFF